MALLLKSSAFGEGTRIPDRYTSDGENVSPPLSWSDPPPGTQSFALICSDPDAPMGTWYHWAIFDLPDDARSLDEDVAKRAGLGTARQAINDFRKRGWGGPCPPKGHGPHRYRFQLLALKVATLSLPEASRCIDVERAAAPHIVGEALLTGTYSR